MRRIAMPTGMVPTLVAAVAAMATLAGVFPPMAAAAEVSPMAAAAGVSPAATAPGVSPAAVAPGVSPAAVAPGPAPQLVTLQWLDAASGTVTRTWTGTPEEAEDIRRTQVPPPDPGGAGEDGGAVLPQLRRVHCTDPNPYWVVRNYPPLVCFADAGDADVAIYRVYEVDSGNNSGYFTWWYNGHGYNQPLGRWTSAIFSVRVTVTHIHIN
jgi:hypothetical protein